MGGFDGVHLGHQKIIREALSISCDRQAELLLITFNYPPKYFFRHTNKYLLDLQEKTKLLAELGVHQLLVLDFNRHLALMLCEEFFYNYLYSPKLVNFFWGHDFAFGKEKQGDLAFVLRKSQEHEFSIYQLPIFYHQGQRVSSSVIRNLLLEGMVDVVAQYLGREYNMQGEVIAGFNLGGQLGFPTANLNWNENKLLPKIGVYHTITNWNNQDYLSITNIGHRPSVHQNKKSDISIETHLLNFHDNLYGQNINLKFVKRLRPEMHFASYEQLSQQIQLDIDSIVKS